MIARPLTEIVAADLTDLITAAVPEGRTIDYKQDLPGNADADKKELLADVSSFANTIGGDLVFGLSEAAGVPTALPGLAATDLDAEMQRLDSIISTGLEPRIRYHIHRVNQTGALPLLVLRVDRSPVGPHRVVFKGHDKFYARNSAGKYPLDVGELRDAFLRSATVADRIRAFRLQRLAAIAGGDTPVPMADGARLVLHLIPLETFSTDVAFDVLPLYRDPTRLQPISSLSWFHRMNVEGVVTHSHGSGGGPSYTQLYRTGVVEAVDGYILSRRIDDRWVIPSITLEERIIEFTRTYLGVQHSLGVSPPVYAFVALLNAKGAWLGAAQDHYDLGDRYSLDREVLSLPEATFLDLDNDPTVTLKPIFDVLWNAFGYPASQNYAKDGQRVVSR